MRPAKFRNSDPVSAPEQRHAFGNDADLAFNFNRMRGEIDAENFDASGAGASRPVSILMVVDLPAPLGPRKPKNCPGATRRLTLSTARRSPKRRVRP